MLDAGSLFRGIVYNKYDPYHIANILYIEDCLAQSTAEISHEAMDHEMDLSSMLWALNKLKAPRAP